MKNKFLSLYPVLWVPCVGDKVRVNKIIDGVGRVVTRHISSRGAYGYIIGDIGEIIVVISEPLLAVQFQTGVSRVLFKSELELLINSHE